MRYTIHPLNDTSGNWDDAPWEGVPIAAIDRFHARTPESPRPLAQAKLIRTNRALCVFFRVQDTAVRAVYTQYQDPVFKDSCVEFFVRPDPGAGYFNFEFNAVGTMLLCYIEDPRRTPQGFAKMTEVPAAIAELVSVETSLTDPVEINEPVTWFLKAQIPFEVFDRTLPSPVTTAAAWTGNFYKCGNDTAHPHWASWSPIGEELNFHCPQHFGELVFAQA